MILPKNVSVRIRYCLKTPAFFSCLGGAFFPTRWRRATSIIISIPRAGRDASDAMGPDKNGTKQQTVEKGHIIMDVRPLFATLVFMLVGPQ